jgi:hypothetical protein
VNGKAVPVLNYVTNMYGGVDVLFLTSELVRGELSDSPFGRFTPGKQLKMDRRVSGPQNRSGRREEKNLVLTGIRTPTSQPSSP